MALAASPSPKKQQAKGKTPQAAPPPAYVLPLTMKYVVPAREPIALFDSAISVTVKPDDTLQSIAARTNAPAWMIAQVNRIGDAPLRPGQSSWFRRSFIRRQQYGGSGQFDAACGNGFRANLSSYSVIRVFSEPAYPRAAVDLD